MTNWQFFMIYAMLCCISAKLASNFTAQIIFEVCGIIGFVFAIVWAIKGK